MTKNRCARSVKTLRSVFKSAEAIDALASVDVYTIEDLISCKFGTLLRLPAVLAEWDSVVTCFIYVYTMRVVSGMKKG